MRSWKARLLVLLAAVGMMLATVSGSAMAQDFTRADCDFLGWEGDEALYLCDRDVGDCEFLGWDGDDEVWLCERDDSFDDGFTANRFGTNFHDDEFDDGFTANRFGTNFHDDEFDGGGLGLVDGGFASRTGGVDVNVNVSV
jgi:hypothetical protein